MSLIPRKTFPDLESFFDDTFPSFRLLPESGFNPSQLAVDIKENDQNFEIKADFPGVNKEDIAITLDNNVLTIAAEHKDEDKEEKEGKVIRRERRFGKYSRSFSLGDGVDEKAVEAKFDNGVLTLSVPKAGKHESARKQIPIK